MRKFKVFTIRVVITHFSQRDLSGSQHALDFQLKALAAHLPKANGRRRLLKDHHTEGGGAALGAWLVGNLNHVGHDRMRQPRSIGRSLGANYFFHAQSSH